MTTTDELVTLLYDSLAVTVRAMAALDDADLDRPCAHPCAGGGTLRDLLTHNVDHERMHAGQIYSARYGLGRMQKREVDRLIAETIRARADVIAALAGLGDADVAAVPAGEGWNVADMVAHTVFWERDSIDHVGSEILGDRAPDVAPFAHTVADPAPHPSG